MLNWANRFSICCFLDNQNYRQAHSTIECLLGVGALTYINANSNALLKLDAYCRNVNDWLFGHLSYDLKSETEDIASTHTDHLHFPLVYFFQPEIVVQVQQNEVSVFSATEQPDAVIRNILKLPATQPPPTAATRPVSIQPRISKEEYINSIQKIQQHILRGDCYELNFCQEFFAENAVLNPLQTWQKLMAISPNPFASYYRLEDKYLLCASPERYLKKTGSRIISQPIKGTFRRDTADSGHDAELKNALYQSEKDRSENVMVVDLVRNDLSRVCEEGTVQVDELFGIYSFPQVHQMISTISGRLQAGISFTDIVRASFPMGSMTGAPKRSVMQLIEQYERSRRGIFSGAVGYLAPGGDFDFNVIIRSIMYNAARQYLSYQVGGGITFYSNAEKEYEECLLKATAIEQVLNPAITPIP